MARKADAALVAAAALFCVAFPLSGQQDSDSSRARTAALLGVVRDTLHGVLSASWEFNRDLRQAGRETVLARAAVLRNRCSSAVIAVRRTPALIDAAAQPLATEQSSRRMRDLKIVMNKLHEVLRVECVAGFPADGAGEHADSLRAWGPYRADQVERSISGFEKAADALANALGIRLEPR